VAGIAVGGTYITYTVTNGVCHLPVSRYITISANKFGNEETIASEEAAVLKLYPNPNKGSFNTHTNGAGTLAIYTLEGKTKQRINYQRALHCSIFLKALRQVFTSANSMGMMEAQL